MSATCLNTSTSIQSSVPPVPNIPFMISTNTPAPSVLLKNHISITNDAQSVMLVPSITAPPSTANDAASAVPIIQRPISVNASISLYSSMVASASNASIHTFSTTLIISARSVLKITSTVSRIKNACHVLMKSPTSMAKSALLVPMAQSGTLPIDTVKPARAA